MAHDEIEQFKKNHARYVRGGPIGKDPFFGYVEGADWSDSLAILIDRLDEVRQFVIDEYLQDNDELKKQESARPTAFGIRHVEKELKCSVYETLFLLNDVQRVLGCLDVAEAESAISIDGAPDIRPKFRKAQLKKRTKKK
jgi:hypothetical protein